MARAWILVNGELVEEPKKAVPVVTIGEGATISFGSDSYPYTVIGVSKNGKKITLREDTAVRKDNRGLSENQEYTYSENLDGRVFVANFRESTGRFHMAGCDYSVGIGHRVRYYDYSF